MKSEPARRRKKEPETVFVQVEMPKADRPRAAEKKAVMDVPVVAPPPPPPAPPPPPLMMPPPPITHVSTPSKKTVESPALPMPSPQTLGFLNDIRSNQVTLF